MLPKAYLRKEMKGMRKCGKMCTACPYIHKTKEIKLHNQKPWKIEKNVSCERYNIIYLLDCINVEKDTVAPLAT